MSHRTALLLLTLILAAPVRAAAPFAFQLPWDDAKNNLPDRSGFNAGIAGASGFVTVGTDAHLYAGGQRIRFLGINITSASCFPEQADSDKIAPRLAKFGVNLVRFHLMDANWNPSYSIFQNPTANTLTLSASNLDKLDYLFAKLKEHGIYGNLNLLAGRDFRSADGIPVAIDSMDWKAKQTPAMIALQKQFAQQLFTHVNPYTGLAYKDDPAVAFVETCNEHGLLHAWKSGMIDSLPVTFQDELQGYWNATLLGKYGTHGALSSAWALTTPSGAEMLLNPAFASGTASWNTEMHNGAVATGTVTSEGPTGNPSYKLQVTTIGTDVWHVQLNQGGLNVSTGTVYTLRFWAKADRTKTIGVEFGMAHDPWQLLGFQKPVTLTTAWQQFTYTLALGTSDANARLNFNNMHDALATYWFADFSLRPGGSIGLLPGENLESGTIRNLYLSELGARTDAARADWTDFLWNKERDYWHAIRDYVKGSLGVHALMIGTVVGNSTPNLMDDFDVIDSHSYWHHPSMPTGWGGPWWIDNWSMVEDGNGGTIGGLALKRVEGKPFSLSEYNHPFPMSFDSEAPLFMAAYGAFQDWDAIYAYTYSDGNRNWSQNYQSSYFDWDSHPGKMMNLLVSANLFRRGDVAPATTNVGVSLSESHEKSILPSTYSWRLVDAGYLGVDNRIPLLHRFTMSTGTNPTSPPGSIPPNSVSIPASGPYVSDTSELVWSPGNKLWTVDTPKTKGVLGYSMGLTFDLGGVSFRPSASLQGWSAIFVTEQDGNNLSSGARRILITATGFVTNTGTDYRIYGTNAAAGSPPASNQQITLASWGISPVLAEGVGAQFVLPYPDAEVSVWALDGKGDRAAAVPVSNEGGNARFAIDASYQTLWYEVAISSPTAPTPIPTPSPTPNSSFLTPTFTPTSTPLVTGSPQFWPNPWKGAGPLWVRLPPADIERTLDATLLTTSARKVHEWKGVTLVAGQTDVGLSLPDKEKPALSNGLYHLRLVCGGKTWKLPLGIVR